MSNLRCRPGDLAIIISSMYSNLIGRIVNVESPYAEQGKWNVRLTGTPALGLVIGTNTLIVTDEWVFKDSSLLPLRAENCEEEVEEASHA